VRTSVLLAVLMLLFSVSSSTQEVEHAPTVAQCQADQASWLSKLESDHDLDNVTIPMLQAWQREMSQCRVVDVPNHHKYYNTEMEAAASESTREYNFIKRHGLLSQLLDEDAAGKR
jgi:hypothetical protein